MFDLPSIRLGRLFGIPLEINLSWLIVFVLVTISLGFGFFPSRIQGLPGFVYLVMAILTALAFFFSIVLHELAHSMVARAGGVHVDRITLFLLGGVSQMDREPKTAGREFVMAFAGPGMSFVIAFVGFVVAYIAIALGAPPAVYFPLQYLWWVNLIVGVFNLLPGFPLDGGRVLRSILWGATGDLSKATRWAARVGQAIGWGMVAIAVVGVVMGGVGLIWFGLIGWFIASLAGQAHRQQQAKDALAQVSVRSAMTPHPEMVPGSISVESLAHDFFLGGRHTRYPVLHGGHVIGLVTLPDVKRQPRDSWTSLLVADVAEQDLPALTVGADESLDAAFDRLAGDTPGALLVVDQGRLIGIVTRADLLAALRRRQFGA